MSVTTWPPLVVAATASEVPITERHRILFGDFRSKPKISTIGGRPIRSARPSETT